MKSILDGVTLGMVHQAKVNDPAIVEGNQHLEQVCVAAGHPLVQCMLPTGLEPRERTLC